MATAAADKSTWATAFMAKSKVKSAMDVTLVNRTIEQFQFGGEADDLIMSMRLYDEKSNTVMIIEPRTFAQDKKSNATKQPHLLVRQVGNNNQVDSQKFSQITTGLFVSRFEPNKYYQHTITLARNKSNSQIDELYYIMASTRLFRVNVYDGVAGKLIGEWHC